MWWLVACAPLGPWSEVEPTEPEGARVVVSPGRLDFGTVSANQERSRSSSFSIYNLGDEAVSVTGHDEVRGDDAGAFTVDAEPIISLDPGDSRSISVTFTAYTEGSWSGQLRVRPGEELLSLLGSGLAPVAEWSAPQVDPVVLGCEGRGALSLDNAGSEMLRVESLTLDNPEFFVVAAPAELGPGERGTIELGFRPSAAGERGALLSVTTNDPQAPAAGLLLSASAYEGERVEERFYYTPANPTDILLVADGGADTRAAFDKLPAGVSTFVEHLRSSNIDYHLAAVAGSPCPDTAPAWAERGDTALATEALVERELVDDDSEWDEALLELAASAVESSAPGGCLEGFRREEGDLYVVLLGDGPATGSAGPPLARLEAAVSPPRSLRISGLIPLSSECGAAVEPYAGAILDTEGTATDFCASDWRAGFSLLAALPSGTEPVALTLGGSPLPETVEVLVEGTTWSAWTFRAEDNAVVFDHETRPALGAEVHVRYVLAVACE